jgi:hypothetical protein
MFKNSNIKIRPYVVSSLMIVALMVIASTPILISMAPTTGSAGEGTQPNSSAASLTPVNLGTADGFVILAKSGITTTGTTTIVGNIGVSPITAAAMTGFGLTMDNSSKFAKSTLVTGNVYASNYADPTPAKMATAIADFEIGFLNATGRLNPTETELGTGILDGMTLTPGLYKWSTVVSISADLTLSGGADDVWIFQCASSLLIGPATEIILSGGAQAKNIFWQVGTQASIGSTAIVQGNILAGTAIVFNSGATLVGKAFAKTAVTMISNSIRGQSVVEDPDIVLPKVLPNENVNLASASDFVLLSETGITSTGNTSIRGNIGSNMAATAITGLNLTLHSSSEYATSSMVSGKVYASDYSSPTPTMMTTAIADFHAAFLNASGRTNANFTELGAGTLSGVVLAPGLYKWTSVVSITGDITLAGTADDVWIFQCATGLTVASDVHIILSGGAQSQNVIWQVGTQATLGTYSVFNGIILAGTAVVFNTGATLQGRAFAKTAITMIDNVVILPSSKSADTNPNSPAGGIAGTPALLTMGIAILSVAALIQFKKKHQIID